MGATVKQQMMDEHADLLEADVPTLLRKLIIEQRETNRLMRNEKKEWLTASEVNVMLGYGPKSRVHQYAREKGFLTTLTSQNPLRYWRPEVEELVKKVAANDVFLGARRT